MKALIPRQRERVAGIDPMEESVGLAHRNGDKIFFFGATEEVVRQVTETYAETYSPDIIAGFRNGCYFPGRACSGTFRRGANE